MTQQSDATVGAVKRNADGTVEPLTAETARQALEQVCEQAGLRAPNTSVILV